MARAAHASTASARSRWTDARDYGAEADRASPESRVFAHSQAKLNHILGRGSLVSCSATLEDRIRSRASNPSR